MNRITNKIISFLRAIEEEKKVQILYACESGSRAWGFPSADSDYDVRFIYLQPVKRYLSVQKRRDVIEIPDDGKLDVNGWDLRKALLLLRKSNPPLLEWLGSPTVYLEEYAVAGQMRASANRYYSATASAYHCLHMARGNYREYLKGDRVWLKKYFYVLRPILAVKWIEQGLGIVPMEFDILVDRVVTDGLLKKEINALIEAKRNGAELDEGPQIAPVNRFLERELNRFSKYQIDHEKHFSPMKQPPAHNAP
ncbi:MAG: nucleotidyltransferase domain-containing protein [Deltaproteobacteria bacterium]|nr:nucleotidyltransferase domain-containing protein [Deltaproteobacteria bacterium]